MTPEQLAKETATLTTTLRALNQHALGGFACRCVNLIESQAQRIRELETENATVWDALDKVCLDWAQEMLARVSPPVSRTAAEAQELRDLRRRFRELEGAAITDAAVERACEGAAAYGYTDGWGTGTADPAGIDRGFIRAALEAAFRSESHQASAEEPA